MMATRERYSVVGALLVASCLSGCQDQSRPTGATEEDGRDVEILFFFDPHCPDCELIKTEFLDLLLARHGYSPEEVVWLDVTEPSVVRRLFQLEESIGFQSHAMAPVILVGETAYCSIDSIVEALGRDA